MIVDKIRGGLLLLLIPIAFLTVLVLAVVAIVWFYLMGLWTVLRGLPLLLRRRRPPAPISPPEPHIQIQRVKLEHPAHE